MMNGLAHVAPRTPNPSGFNIDDYEARVGAAMGTTGANGLARTNPYQAPTSKFENGLLGKTLDAFQAGLDPRGREFRLASGKEAAKEKGMQTLALMKAQRNIPAEQRGQWWQQNAPQIAQITGVDTSQPADPNQFTDQALDGHIATLSAQLGIAPEAPEYQLANLGNGGVGAFDPRTGNVDIKREPATAADEDEWDTVTDADGAMHWINKRTKQTEPMNMKGKGNQPAPPSGYRWVAGGGLEPIPGGPADKGSGDGGMDPERIRLEREYAKDWKSIDGNFKDIDGQFKRMEALSTMAESDPKKAAAADLGMLVSFTKMLDPGSVAREGEVKLTQSAASLVDQVAIWLPRLQQGNTLLPPELRKAYLEAAREMYGIYSDTYHSLAQDYRSTAEAYKYDPARVMMGYRGPAPAAPAGGKPDLDAMLDQAPPFVQKLFRDRGQSQAQAVPANIPPEAAAELRANPTPEEMAMFDEAFGEGSAQRVLNGAR